MTTSHDCVDIKTVNFTNDDLENFTGIIQGSGKYLIRKPKHYSISYHAEYLGDDSTQLPLDRLIEDFKDNGYEVILENPTAGPYPKALIKVEKKKNSAAA